VFLREAMESVCRFEVEGAGSSVLKGQAIISKAVSPFVTTYTKVTTRKRLITGYYGKTMSTKKATYIEFDSFPQDVAVDHHNTSDVFILDSVEKGSGTQILRISNDGRTRATIKLPTPLGRCRSLTVNHKGEIFVSMVTSVIRYKIESHPVPVKDEDVWEGGHAEGGLLFNVRSSDEFPGISPLGITSDGQGNIFAIDATDGVVKRLEESSRQWLPATPRLYDLRALAMQKNTSQKSNFYCPYGLAFDPHDGSLVAASIDQVIRVKPGFNTEEIMGTKLEILGQKSELNTTYHDKIQRNRHGAMIRQAGVTVVNGTRDIIVSDSLRHAIWKIGVDGAMHCLAGHPPKGGNFSRGWHDGVGQHAKFNMPAGLAAHPSGIVYACDMRNHKIRKIKMRSRSFSKHLQGAHDEELQEGASSDDDEYDDNATGVEVDALPTEGAIDSTKLRPDDLAWMMRRDKKLKSGTRYRRARYRKKMRRKRAERGIGYVDAPDEMRHRQVLFKDKPKTGTRQFNTGLNRVEIYE